MQRWRGLRFSTKPRSRVQLRAIETTDVERRLAKLEREAAANNTPASSLSVPLACTESSLVAPQP
jgi:hypothetical protein